MLEQMTIQNTGFGQIVTVLDYLVDHMIPLGYNQETNGRRGLWISRVIMVTKKAKHINFLLFLAHDQVCHMVSITEFTKLILILKFLMFFL